MAPIDTMATPATRTLRDRQAEPVNHFPRSRREAFVGVRAMARTAALPLRLRVSKGFRRFMNVADSSLWVRGDSLTQAPM